MAHKELVIALGMIATSSPALASTPEPAPTIVAPAGDADTRYCLRIEASTGTLLERIRCKTRDEWASQDVDVDKDWAREGVAIIRGGITIKRADL
ncbi:MAG TPA: hypothetical protein VNJ05_09050 [Sphingomicrobium sp.]|nr:hypothetical protein [Sphingomicrobium sp.]